MPFVTSCRQKMGFDDSTISVFTPTALTCCSQRETAYGGTVETAVMLRGYAGLTLGADVVHGVGRTSTAGRIGVRLGS